MLIKKLFLALVLGMMSLGMAFADESADEMHTVERISKSIALINQPHSVVWPDLQIKEPVVVYYSISRGAYRHVYAFNNYKPVVAGMFSSSTYSHDWEKKVVNGAGYFFLDQLDFISVGSAASGGWLTMENNNVFIYNLGLPLSSPNTAEMNGSRYMYRYFKRYEQQKSAGFQPYIAEKQKSEDLNKAKPPYTDLYQQSNIELMYLELKALEDYALHHNLQALKYYAAMNQVRLSALQDDSIRYEKNDGLLSGTAEYVSWKSQGETEQFYFDKMLSQYNIPEVTVAISYSFAEYLPRYLHPIAKFAKHFNQYVTPLVGAGLDEIYNSIGVDPNIWKRGVELRHISANEALQNYYNMTMDEANSLVAAAKKLYGFDEKIQPKLEKILGSYQQVMQAELQNYQNLPGVEVIINVPKMLHTHNGGLHLPIDNQTVMLVHSSGQVYSDSTKQKTPEISYTKIPCIFITDTHTKNKAYTTLKFKIQSNDSIDLGALVGKKTGDLAAMTSTVFTGNVNLNANQIKITALGEDGIVQGSNGQLKITVNKINYYTRSLWELLH